MIPIFDNGHGGIIDGVYQTAGKRSPSWGNGTLFEGVFDRMIVKALVRRCEENGIPYEYVSDSDTDVPLGVRVRRANEVYRKWNTEEGVIAYLLSIHANAGGGSGWEIFSSRGYTTSDKVVEIFSKYLSNLPLPNRGEKEADFYVLKDTQGPAVLIECAFMDNRNDYELLWSKAFHQQLEDEIFSAIEELYNIDAP